MIFRRIVLCALLVGGLSGLALSVIQQFGIVPIIEAAEVFEAGGISPAATVIAHDDAATHAHEAEAWAPAEGAERRIWTVITNSLTSIGFSLLLIAAITGCEHHQRPSASASNGLLWGAAGYLVVFALPALGLPPEIPGASTAALGERQQWWLLTVACGGGALSGLAFLRSPLRWAAPALLAVPFLIGAPHLAVGPFDAYGSEIATQMEALARRFVMIAALSNAVYWLILGALAGGAVSRWIRPALRQADKPLVT